MRPAAAGDGRAVTAVLVALALLRAATAFLPSMWAWGLDAQRFLAPLPAWLPWLALALPLLPRVGAALAPRLDRAGDGLGGALASWLVALAAVVAAASIVCGGWLTCFTGLGKPAALLCVLTAAALLGATRLARTGQGGVLLGGSVAAAFLLHRSGLALAPLWLAALVPAFRG